MLASGWAYSALRIRTDREQTLQSEGERLRVVAVALETGTLAMLNDGVGAAVTRAGEIESAGGLASASPQALRATLGKAETSGQYVRSVFVTNPGRFARAARSGALEELVGAPPAWFTPPGAGDPAEVWVGKPVADPDHAGRTVVPVARRVRSAHTAGLWAGALFDFGSFGSLRTQLGGPDGIITLLTTDGILLAAMENPADGPHLTVGASYASSPLFQRAPTSSPSGVIEGFAPRIGTDVVFAYGRVQGYPLTVATGRRLDPMLAPWRERLRTTLIVTAGYTALVLAMTLLLGHSLKALRRRELHYRTLFNNAAFSAFLLEGERCIGVNDTAMRRFGLPDEAAVHGVTLGALSPPVQPDGRPSAEAARERFAQALRDGNTTFEWLHKRLDTGETFPTEVSLSSLRVDRTVLALAVVRDLSVRKRAEQGHRESEGRYRALVDALPEAVFVHRGGELLFGNDAARRLVGAAPDDPLTGRSVLSFAFEADREALQQRTRQILEQGVSAEPREARVRRLDGSLIWVEVQGVRVEYGGEPAVQTLMRDITASKRRQEQEAARLERMQRQSAALLRLASRGETGWGGLDSTLQAICTSAAQVLGAERVSIWLLQAQGGALRCAALYERDAPQRADALTVPAAQVPLYLEAIGRERVIECEALVQDPRLRQFSAAAWPEHPARSMIAAAARISGELAGVLSINQLTMPRAWQPDEVSFAGGIADQVAQALLDSQREEALEDLRLLAGELMRIQDEERRRIGRDLHDSTGQVLAALEMDLARLSDCGRSLESAGRELLENAVRLARQCSTEIRTASYLLHPPLLDELGLVSALRWLGDGLRERGAIEMRLELPESVPRLRPAEELTLFRVAQEALTNAQRHSSSPWVAVRLTVRAESVCLEVEDAGRGLSGPGGVRAAATPSSGVGLAGMRERIRQVGGTFTVESTGSGTRIRATVPRHSLSEVRRA